MILTVTPDPALDKVFFIDEWTPGGKMHSLRTVLSVGGRGLDISVALRHLGVPTAAVCFLAGETGVTLQGLLVAYGIEIHPLWVEGETRTAHVVVERRQQRHSHLFSGGIAPTPQQEQTMLDLCRTLLPKARWVCSGGRLPPTVTIDFFARLNALCQRQGVPFLLDAYGFPLRATLVPPPQVVKMNRQEFESTFEVSASHLEDLRLAAQEIVRAYGLPSLVLTGSEEGMLAFTEAGTWRAVAPPQQVVSSAGAGDAAAAALAWRLAQGDGWTEALRWAVASGAAATLTEGTADLRLEDVQRLFSQVSVETLD